MIHVYNFSKIIRKHRPPTHLLIFTITNSEPVSPRAICSKKPSLTLQEAHYPPFLIAMACVNFVTYHFAIFDLESFPAWLARFSCKFCVDRHSSYFFSHIRALLLKMGSMHQQHGPHIGACLNQYLSPCPGYPESDSAS